MAAAGGDLQRDHIGRRDQQPAGQGDVPLAEVLTGDLNIPYAVIEFDHYEGNTFDAIAQSFAYLTKTLA